MSTHGHPSFNRSLTRSLAGSFTALATTLLLFGAPCKGTAQSDDFNDGNDTTPLPPWIRYDPIGTGTWSFPGGNTYRIQSAPSPDPGNFGQGRAGSVRPVNYSNFYVAVDVVNWDDAIHQVFGVLARTGTIGAGTTTGYMFTYDRGNPASSTAGDMDIIRLDGESPSNLPTTGSDSIHLVPGKQYRFVFIGLGPNFTGQVYELPNTLIPLVEITATDSTYASGPSGLVVANNNSPTYDGPADATFDNFLAAVAEPNLFDNFNDGDDTNPLPAWQRFDPIGTGGWSFPGGNTYRIQSAPSPDVNYGQGRAASIKPGNYTDFYVAADVVGWDDSLDQAFGVLSRADNVGPGMTTGYLFSYARDNPASSTAGDMDIVRIDGEIPTSLPTTGSDSIHFVPGKNYRLAFIGVGNSFTGRVYELPNMSVPVLEITATDSTYANGSPGLVVADNSPNADGPADATFDNFLTLTAEPRLSITLSSGEVSVSWPLIPFRLQSSPSLSPAWTAITSGITQTGGQNVYSAPAADAAQFYRLIYP